MSAGRRPRGGDASAQANRPALDAPIQALAAAHAVLVHGCDRAACSSGSVGGRPAPWVLGLPNPTLIAEAWSTIHATHRRKRGFSAVVARLEALLALVPDIGGTAAIIEVWADSGDEPDSGLLEKLGRQINHDIVVFGAREMAAALEAVESAVRSDQTTHVNPIVAVFALRKAFRSPPRG